MEHFLHIIMLENLKFCTGNWAELMRRRTIMRKILIYIALTGICFTPLSAGIYPDFFNNSDHGQYDADDYLEYIASGVYTSASFNNSTSGAGNVTGLTGSYQITAFAFEAGYDNQVYLELAIGNKVLFNNYNTSNYGTWINVTDVTQLFFNDQHGFTQQLVLSDVNMYTLTQAITVPTSGLYLGAGTIIFGWNDGWDGDTDHDDMFIALRAVPEPGLLLLLGSSLLGLAAFKRYI